MTGLYTRKHNLQKRLQNLDCKTTFQGVNLNPQRDPRRFMPFEITMYLTDWMRQSEPNVIVIGQ